MTSITASTETKTAEQSHDETLVGMLESLTSARRVRESNIATVMRMAHFPTSYRGRRLVYLVDGREAHYTDAVAALEAAGSMEQRDLSAGTSPAQAIAEVERAGELVAEAKARIDRHEESYTGWTRYMLVTSSAGHVHRSTACSTCRPTTVFAWITDLSGQDEEAAIKRTGPALCSVCFPNAPVDWQGEKLTASQAKAIAEGKTPAAKKPACAGSGKAATALTPNRRYGKCSECGQTMGVSVYGIVRRHGPAA